MTSRPLDLAVARVRTVFAGMSSPTETGCGRCHLPGETALLRTPDVPVPPDVLSRYAAEVADHFDDLDASMRRLLPDLVELLVAGGVDGAYGGLNALGRTRWGRWPAEQREAVHGFFEAWFTQVLRTPPEESGGGTTCHDVLQSCVTSLSTVTPFLAIWAAEGYGGSADAHLLVCVERYIDDLIVDEWPLGWWADHGRDEPVAELRAWVCEQAPDRLRAVGADPALLLRVEVLGLPCDDRWPALEALDHPTGAGDG
ncbi:hypothetical protein PUR28_24995 [Streptomyces sp. BE308]|uniref:hypothetical protein n=1 Tax=Streptomyces sp. BE308 TaxID=3002529 RepID=UPI002E767CA7|nr:hypothetical protein [Streptomyces sp. BE308]MEE1793995.1 hypothetical protein [Streptomyces sp. BE308]